MPEREKQIARVIPFPRQPLPFGRQLERGGIGSMPKKGTLIDMKEYIAKRDKAFGRR